ncbi:hypothetical protein DFA_06125 [Cavenderia fasciculata]|uniref:Uncharacterized protein n=1 Tax=Cavenderia fasciculata TaxID=261658 RepID=F4PK63_CACFS|nr:uncharacterized protein DFA_06125 [Cavenderia fasciculata]EGG23987.1 hypothetical protein DFA_06125 [Cavenderia fasciculata]|eukprot:XP_004361838.1 hypothetical protein DFA_06125 [Cavenderia fasciculata]
MVDGYTIFGPHNSDLIGNRYTLHVDISNELADVPLLSPPRLTCFLETNRPKSQGYVQIKSTDPFVDPIIFANYYDHEGDAEDAALEMFNIKSTTTLYTIFDTLCQQTIPTCFYKDIKNDRLYDLTPFTYTNYLIWMDNILFKSNPFCNTDGAASCNVYEGSTTQGVSSYVNTSVFLPLASNLPKGVAIKATKPSSSGCPTGNNVTVNYLCGGSKSQYKIHCTEPTKCTYQCDLTHPDVCPLVHSVSGGQSSNYGVITFFIPILFIISLFKSI